MRHVRLAGRPLLAVVRLHREVERTIDPAEVGGRVLLGDRRLQRRSQCLEIGRSLDTGPRRDGSPRSSSRGRLRGRLGRRCRRRRGRRGSRVTSGRRRTPRARRRRRGRGRSGLRS